MHNNLGEGKPSSPLKNKQYMRNEEKAREIGQTIVIEDCGWQRYDIAEFAALKMAKWKDQQFKGYLAKKKEELFNTNCLSVLPFLEFIDEIINELFPESEQDNTDREE